MSPTEPMALGADSEPWLPRYMDVLKKSRPPHPRPEPVALIDGEVQRVNKGFSSVEQIKKFRLIDVLLTAEDEELTPTMKLKRSFVGEKYNDLIEAMYAG